jgi:hypothetical protein
MSWRACNERGRHGSNGLRWPVSCLSDRPGNGASRCLRMSCAAPPAIAAARVRVDYRRDAATF